jgi:hypothetical protein
MHGMEPVFERSPEADRPGGDGSAPKHRIDEDAALRLILEGTVRETGTAFFRALVKNLAQALDTSGARVTEYLPAERKLRSLAFWMGHDYIETYEYPKGAGSWQWQHRKQRSPSRAGWSTGSIPRRFGPRSRRRPRIAPGG